MEEICFHGKMLEIIHAKQTAPRLALPPASSPTSLGLHHGSAPMYLGGGCGHSSACLVDADAGDVVLVGVDDDLRCCSFWVLGRQQILPANKQTDNILFDHIALI